jgi:hypothetical protein
LKQKKEWEKSYVCLVLPTGGVKKDIKKKAYKGAYFIIYLFNIGKLHDSIAVKAGAFLTPRNYFDTFQRGGSGL